MAHTAEWTGLLSAHRGAVEISSTPLSTTCIYLAEREMVAEVPGGERGGGDEGADPATRTTENYLTRGR